jgi:hypothetical protein
MPATVRHVGFAGVRRSIAHLAVAILVVACGAPASSSAAAPVPASASGSGAPASVTALPRVICETGIDPADCSPFSQAALGALASSGHKPTDVWISSGVLCPFVDNCLFNPDANFPAPMIRDPSATDGQMLMPIGSVEVAFADTDEHAGLHLYRVNGVLTPKLVGYRVPDPGWCSGSCPSSSTTSGPFHLELVLSRTEWRVGAAIHGTAILSYAGAAPVTLGGASVLIGFGYQEVGGKRSFGPAFDAACAATTIDPATPVSVPLGKSGGYDANNPDAAWIIAFMNASGVQLPEGTWDVTAEAPFTDAAGCTGTPRDLKATLRVTVGG